MKQPKTERFASAGFRPLAYANLLDDLQSTLPAVPKAAFFQEKPRLQPTQ
jgi:hypothetical protein